MIVIGLPIATYAYSDRFHLWSSFSRHVLCVIRNKHVSLHHCHRRRKPSDWWSDLCTVLAFWFICQRISREGRRDTSFVFAAKVETEIQPKFLSQDSIAQTVSNSSNNSLPFRTSVSTIRFNTNNAYFLFFVFVCMAVDTKVRIRISDKTKAHE